MRDFDGHTVFITGGSSGIGAALGRAFASSGARVALAARSEDRLAGVINEIVGGGGEAMAVKCDVTSRADLDSGIARIVERFGSLDVVVANAGFGVSGPFEALTTEDYRRQFDTNFFGVVDTIYAALPHVVASRGRIAIISSVYGKLGGPTTSAYCASKFALNGLSESIYYELADKGVSVTCINPGVIESNFRMVDNANQWHPEKSDPVPRWIAMDTDKAARQIVRAIARRKPEVTITAHGKLAVLLHNHFPRTFRFIFRQITRGRIEKMEEIRRGKKHI